MLTLKRRPCAGERQFIYLLTLYLYENWPDFDEDLFFLIQDALLKKISSSHFKIMGFDKAPSAVKKAKENIENANLSDFIGVHHVNFFNSRKEVFGNTTILFNPPYGERLELADIEGFYKNIGDNKNDCNYN